MKPAIVISAIVLLGGFVFWKDLRAVLANDQHSEIAVEKQKPETKDEASPDVRIRTKWELPGELTEISGLAWMDMDRLACVQDEEGAIYLYNRTEKKIENKIPFAGPGDFEGVALNGRTAYAVRADGVLYEVNLDAGKSSAKEYKTPLTVHHNVEGLTYDAKHNRLLLAIKNSEPGAKDYKGIYAFNLSSKTMEQEPVIKIDLKEEVFQNSKGKKTKTVMPSAISIHPLTGDYYIADGPASRLLILGRNGEVKKLVNLGKEFRQPEGLAFSPEGSLYISNEGGKGSGNILEVEVD